MPTIFKYPKKIRVQNDNKKNRHKWVYNTKRWQDIRLIKLGENPVCEVCQEKNKITLAEQVHHIVFLSSVTTKEDLQRIGFDFENLKSVCVECHEEIHKTK